MGDSEYHIWEGSSVRIRMRRSVMEHINDEVMKGFTSVPKRGAEVGGILLGKTDDDGLNLTVEDFEPVPCEHRFGPSYHLSPADIQNLEETLDWFRADSHGNLSVLAFYRSHTRYGFFLSEEDEKLLAKYFAEPGTAILLIKPLRVQASVADFFLRQNDRLQEAAEPVPFPFGLPPIQTESWSATEAGTVETAPRRIEEPPAPPPVQPENPKVSLPVEPLPLTPPALPPLPAKRGARKWIWAAVTTAMLIAGAILLHETLGHGSAASPQSVSLLGLRAVGDHERVHVFWDGDARAIQDAQRAILTISDGAARRELTLTSEQLRRGALLYVPRDGNLTFRMNVYSRADTVSAESVRLQVTIPRGL